MDPAKMKVVDLRSQLGALGLDTKGNKPALVERLKKAMESATGKALPDTSILDTSTEDVCDTPLRSKPAARTTRRSSSSRLAGTPAKQPRIEEPVIEEQADNSPEDSPKPVPVPEVTPAPEPEPVQQQPEPKFTEPEKEPAKNPGDELYSIDDDSQSPPPVAVKEEEEEAAMDTQEAQEEASHSAGNVDSDKKTDDTTTVVEVKKEDDKNGREPRRSRFEMSEEEEWAELNKRLKEREAERLEREKKQAEEDARKLEELKDNPVKLQRLKRKYEKKARWSNYYRTIEATNEILTPPNESEMLKKSVKEVAETKMQEPEIDDNKVTLSWYDSDLNQYLDPLLNAVVPLSEGAFSHAWAGARATHGVNSSKVCFEVRVGSIVTTTESAEKEMLASGLRVGWSTDDQNLHLGEGELSWGYESTGRAVNNGEYKDYGKKFEEKDVIGVYLDLESTPCKISYTHNGEELGPAFEFDKSILNGKALFPHVLTKNMCYAVNFGYDKYNMLSKTKIIRRRLEIPVEQVLEEKKKKEEELKRIKEEAANRERERREKEKKEREERMRKKREEREKLERERKEKEAQEKQEKGEGEPEDTNAESNAQEAENTPEDSNKENGDKPEESSKEESAEPKQDSMDVDKPASEPDAKEKAEEKGELQEVTEDQVYQGIALDKRVKFIIRFTVDEELDGSEAELLPGYVLICKATSLVDGPRQLPDLASCEVILMVGMPGAGKTYWARQHTLENPDKRYNLLSTGALFDKMKVDCKPFRATYEGRWDAMVSKCAKCVLKLLEIARGRKRNYILDQTNVYPSAQRRKLREFDGYRRIAVVIVPTLEEYKLRQAKRDSADGKDVPDAAIVDMKANFSLPEKCSWIDEVIFPELNEEEAKKIIEEFHKEAKSAGVVKEKDRRDRSESREGPPNKRPKSNDRRRGRDDRRGGRDFGGRTDRNEGRWGPRGGGGGGGGGGPPGRWGPPGRFPPGPPPRRDQRPPQHWDNRGDFNRGGDRDGFRGRPGRDQPPHRPDPNNRFNRGPDRGPHRGNLEKRGPPVPPPGMPPQQGPPTGGPGPNAGGTWQRAGMNMNNRPNNRPNNNQRMMQKPDGNQPPGPQGQNQGQGQMQGQGQGQNQGQQQGNWNQWAGGWGGWGNWNQNQAANWNNWNNWGNWNQQQQAQSQQPNQATTSGSNNKSGTNNQWGNYSAQQWYQWQQWQQQQQQQPWQQYGQGQGNNNQQGQQTGNNEAAQAAWAQYYQNYNNANASAGQPANTNSITGSDSK